MAGNAKQFLRERGRGEDKIDATRRDGARRHREVFGRLVVLRKSDSALALDFLQAQRSVAAHAREHDPDRAMLLLERQRPEKTSIGIIGPFAGSLPPSLNWPSRSVTLALAGST